VLGGRVNWCGTVSLISFVAQLHKLLTQSACHVRCLIKPNQTPGFRRGFHTVTPVSRRFWWRLASLQMLLSPRCD
jgi:hypothetical protein